MTRGSDSGPQKMKGTTTHSRKLGSQEAGATTILQQNSRDGRRLGKCRGEIGRTRELTRDSLLRGTFTFPIKNDFEKLSAAPIERLHSQDSRATSRRQVEQHSLFGDALKHSLLKKERVARRTTYTLMRRRSK